MLEKLMNLFERFVIAMERIAAAQDERAKTLVDVAMQAKAETAQAEAAEKPKGKGKAKPKEEPKAEEPKVEEDDFLGEPETKPEPPKYTMEDVRLALVGLAKKVGGDEGKAKAKQLMVEVGGADKLSAIKPEKYGEIIAKAA